MTAREILRRATVWTIVCAGIAGGVLVSVQAGTDGLWVALGWSGYGIVGGVILTSRPGNAVGRILAFIGAGWGLYALLAVGGAAGALPVWFEVAAESVGYLLWIALTALVLVFPSGSPGTRAGRAIGAVALVVAVLMVSVAVIDPSPLEISGRPRPWALPGASPVTDALVDGGGFFLVPLLMLAALVELGFRWWRGSPTERLQFRWFALGGATMALSLAVSQAFPGLPEPVGFAMTLAFNAIPVSIGIAVTRHGLYAIGRVVSRTVAYAITTAGAVGVYALVVTSITWLLPGAPSIAVAAATLAAAALALPLLRAVQHIVDRRFDRERYDARATVDAFGERLRTHVDPGDTGTDLRVAVDRTLQPAASGLWTSGGTP